MALSRDQDTLRIPAFLRKKSIRKKLSKPLLMTALDRKRAGQLPEGLEKKIEGTSKASAKKLIRPKGETIRKKTLSTPKPRAPLPSQNFFTPPVLAEKPMRREISEDLALPVRAKQKEGGRVRAKRGELVGVKREAFLVSPRIIGEMTHYYDKIRVGVIKLKGTLEVSDSITYETDKGQYTQVVESMEVNREPVFKAGRGKEIGLKLAKIPRIGTLVTRNL